jgi:hypothetical protein
VRGDVGVLDRHLEQVGHIAPEQRGLYLNLVRAQLDAAGAQVHETTRARVVRWLAEHER